MTGDAGQPDGAPNTIRVAVFAPYPTLRFGLRALLEAEPGIEVVADLDAPPAADDTPTYDAAVGDAGDHPALEALPDGLPVVLLIGDAIPAFTLENLAATPLAILPRDADAREIIVALQAVASGLMVLDRRVVAATFGAPAGVAPAPEDLALTAREVDVLALLAEGLPNKQIAARLGISEHTAKFHVGAILGKLGASSRTEAVMLAARRGVLPL